ncbi:MAG: ABC transporter substrate-binding protein [Eubacteriaceae bacterium]|nr:ABC transporter substrate-binding protein [Eubacteriaceae bacterium]
MKKKLILIILVAALLIPGCAGKNLINEEKKIEIAVLSGPTGMGMAKMMSEELNLGEDVTVNYTIAGSPDQLTAGIIKGDFDLAALPTNLAAVLYNKTGSIKLAAVNTLGTLYILGRTGDSYKSTADLKGKTLYAAGQGATPEYVLRYILMKNGMDPDGDLQIKFFQEHSEAAAKFMQDEDSLVLLPEPFATSVKMKGKEVTVAFDLTKEWEKVTDGASLPMGCLVVKKEFADKYPEALAYILETYKKSTEFVNKNPKEASQIIEESGIIPEAALAEKSISGSHIVYIAGDDARRMLDSYYQVLYDFSSNAVGGAVPNEGFYYSK